MAEKISSGSKTWWIYLVLGILVLICGGNFLANPLATLSTIAIFTGIYFIVAGAAGAITAIVDRKTISLWGLHLALQIIVVLAGIFMLTRPAFAAAYLWLITGIGFLSEGVIMIFLSIGVKKMGSSSWIIMLIFGILITLASIMVLSDPLAGLGFVAVFVAICVICFGINLIVFSFHVKEN